MKSWNEQNDSEIKRTALLVLIEGVVGSIVVSILFFFMLKDLFACVCGFLGMFLLGVYCAIVVLKRDWLDEKIGVFDSDFPGISYQCAVVFLVALSIALSFAFFGMAFVQAGIYSAIAFGVAQYFPTIFMLLRLDVYKNENSRWLLVEDEFGNKSYAEVIGYFPIFYFVFLGIPFARGPLGVSIKYILESIFLNKGLLSYDIFCFIVSLIVGSLVLSPDIMNKILPFELKTGNGLKKFMFIGIIMIALNLLMMVTEVYNVIITML